MKTKFFTLVILLSMHLFSNAQNTTPANSSVKKEQAKPRIADDAVMEKDEMQMEAPSNSNSTTTGTTYKSKASTAEAKSQIVSMKISYISQKLNLTPSEAQNFWPVYNEFDAEMKKLKTNTKLDKLETKLNYEKLSDQELEKHIDQIVADKMKESDLVKIYHDKFKKVLPIRKVAMLYHAENQFRKELLNKLKN